MLRMVNLEEIERLLLRVPDLADQLDRRDPEFVLAVKRWLQELEAVLESNRMAVVGNVAGLRGVLTAAERGLVPEGIDIRGRPSTRKVREAVGADVVHRVGVLIAGAIQQDASRIEEARRFMRQVVALANVKGLIPEPPDDGDVTGYLNAVWRAMTDDPEIGPGVTHLLGLVGRYDALILLDRTVTSDLFGMPAG